MGELFRLLRWAFGLPAESGHAIPVDPTLLLELRYKTQRMKGRDDERLDLAKSRFIVFDLETTGLHPYAGDQITSISAVVIENGKLRHDIYYDTLVDPGRPIPAVATEITGITNEMVVGKPNIIRAMNDFLDFVGGNTLVAHNADFDIKFLNIPLKRYCQSKVYHPVIDTFTLSLALMPCQKSHTLDGLAKIFDLETKGRHTSLGDALLAAEVFLIFQNMLQERGIYTLGDLYKYLHCSTSLSC